MADDAMSVGPPSTLGTLNANPDVPLLPPVSLDPNTSISQPNRNRGMMNRGTIDPRVDGPSTQTPTDVGISPIVILQRLAYTTDTQPHLISTVSDNFTGPDAGGDR